MCGEVEVLGMGNLARGCLCLPLPRVIDGPIDAPMRSKGKRPTSRSRIPEETVY